MPSAGPPMQGLRIISCRRHPKLSHRSHAASSHRCGERHRNPVTYELLLAISNKAGHWPRSMCQTARAPVPTRQHWDPLARATLAISPHRPLALVPFRIQQTHFFFRLPASISRFPVPDKRRMNLRGWNAWHSRKEKLMCLFLGMKTLCPEKEMGGMAIGNTYFPRDLVTRECREETRVTEPTLGYGGPCGSTRSLFTIQILPAAYCAPDLTATGSGCAPLGLRTFQPREVSLCAGREQRQCGTPTPVVRASPRRSINFDEPVDLTLGAWISGSARSRYGEAQKRGGQDENGDHPSGLLTRKGGEVCVTRIYGRPLSPRSADSLPLASGNPRSSRSFLFLPSLRHRPSHSGPGDS